MNSKSARIPSPRFAGLWQEGAARFRDGDLSRAAEVYAALAKAERKNPEVWMMLGVVSEKLGNAKAAEDAYRKAIALDPRYAEAYANLASALHKLGDKNQAIRCLQKAVTLNPGLSAAQLRLGGLLVEGGRYSEAETHLSPLAETADSDSLAVSLLAIAKHRLGKLTEAERLFRRVSERDGGSFAAHSNLGIVLLEDGRCEEALECFAKALALRPDLTEAHLNRIKALACLRRIDEAERELERVRKTEPDKADSLFDLRATRGRIEDELPIAKTARLLFYEQWASRLEVCDWKDYDLNLATAKVVAEAEMEQENAVELPGLRPFRSLLLPLTPDFQLELARNFSRRIGASMAPVRESTNRSAPPAPSPRLRIGYVSPDFRKGVVGLLFRSMFALHDRSSFEVFGYSLSSDDRSPEHQEIRRGCDDFAYLNSLNNREAAERIVRDGIHILIDMAGYVASCRPEIFALRPAPIQVNFAGYPGSTGAEWIDYKILSRASLDSSSARHYSERLVWLPETHHIVSSLPRTYDRPVSRTEQGLPESGFVFCCFQGSKKIDPMVFDVWMRILNRVPGSVLWLLGEREQARENLRGNAARRDVDPDRLVFADLVEIPAHIARQTLADLFLDSFVYSGLTTVAMGLWSGVPVVTCGGATLVSRLGSGAARAFGMEELVVGDLVEYEERAVCLATDPERLRALATRVRERRSTSPLFDPGRTVRYLEKAYRMMWQRYENGEPPTQFAVPSIDGRT